MGVADQLQLTLGFHGANIHIVSELLRAEPERVSHRAMAGVLAARRGNLVKTREIAASLETGRRGDRSERARHLARAQIAAAMRKDAEAITLLQSIPHRSHPDDFQLFHSDPAFHTLRDNAGFRASFVRGAEPSGRTC